MIINVGFIWRKYKIFKRKTCHHKFTVKNQFPRFEFFFNFFFLNKQKYVAFLIFWVILRWHWQSHNIDFSVNLFLLLIKKYWLTSKINRWSRELTEKFISKIRDREFILSSICRYTHYHYHLSVRLTTKDFEFRNWERFC